MTKLEQLKQQLEVAQREYDEQESILFHRVETLKDEIEKIEQEELNKTREQLGMNDVSRMLKLFNKYLYNK